MIEESLSESEMEDDVKESISKNSDIDEMSIDTFRNINSFQDKQFNV